MVEPITAVGWGVSALGWVASPIISKLLTKGFDYLGYDTAKKLAQLEPKILVLEQVMQDVETSPYRPRLEKLFKELKSAFYEAEEILDAVEYHCLQRQIQDGKLKSSMDKFRASMANFFSLKNEVHISEMAKECYVVFIGRVPGVYRHWLDAQAQVNGYSGASHRGFDTRAKGKNAYLRWTLKQERERNRRLKKYYIIVLMLIPIALLSSYIMV